METDNTVFKIPGFERQKAYNFEAIDESPKVYEKVSDIYEELKAINEEIERCRLRNS